MPELELNYLCNPEAIRTSNLAFGWIKGTDSITKMKKTHIIILVAIFIAIIGLLTYSVDFSTYSTIISAQNSKGKFLHLMVKLDRTKPIEYDPVKNPNYLAFYAVDSLGGKTKVVYHNNKPTELESSERIVIKGKMQEDHFECSEILLKCPSKYKDDKDQLQKKVKEETASI